MKLLHPLLTISLFCLWNIAEAGQYDWVIQKIPNHLAEVGNATVGIIDKF